jgi:hypothetical protein
MGWPARTCAGTAFSDRKEIPLSGLAGKHPRLVSRLTRSTQDKAGPRISREMKHSYDLRNPAEPMPPPVKEPPPEGPENPDVPVREPDPDEPGEI